MDTKLINNNYRSGEGREGGSEGGGERRMRTLVRLYRPEDVNTVTETTNN